MTTRDHPHGGHRREGQTRRFDQHAFAFCLVGRTYARYVEGETGSELSRALFITGLSWNEPDSIGKHWDLDRSALMHDDNGLMPDVGDCVIRNYVDREEPSWLRCRVLSFLPTAYFDDVVVQKPPVGSLGFEVVAVDVFESVVGVMDIVVDGTVATIDTLAVHPDHQHRGIARALLAHTVGQAQARALTEISAWTRDDPAALGFYRATGFVETDRYLHVFASRHADGGELDRAIDAMSPGLRLVSAFFHAEVDDEIELRQKYSRVHICRRFTRAL